MQVNTNVINKGCCASGGLAMCLVAFGANVLSAFQLFFAASEDMQDKASMQVDGPKHMQSLSCGSLLSKLLR